MSELRHYDEASPSAPWLEAMQKQGFGDKLDAIVAATAEAFPDRPLERLGLEVVITIKPRHAGEIRCHIGSKKDLRWIIKVLGPPTSVVPGVALFWTFS